MFAVPPALLTATAEVATGFVCRPTLSDHFYCNKTDEKNKAFDTGSLNEEQDVDEEPCNEKVFIFVTSGTAKRIAVSFICPKRTNFLLGL